MKGKGKGHATNDPMTYVRLLTSTRNRMRDMFPDKSYPAIVDTLLEYYEQHETKQSE